MLYHTVLYHPHLTLCVWNLTCKTLKIPLHLRYSLQRYAEDKYFSQHVYPGWQCGDLLYSIKSLQYIPHGQTPLSLISVPFTKVCSFTFTIGTIPVSYFSGWQQIWKLPRITLYAGTHALDKCKKTSYPPYRYKAPTSMKSSHCIQLNVEYSPSRVYPNLTQTLELCTLFTITLLITPLIVPNYLRLVKLAKDMPDSVGMTFSSLVQLLNQVRPCLQLAHYMTDVTVQCSAAFSKITSVYLSYTSHANKVQCAARSHATCRCV
jgi:hypothetical protein